MRLSKSAALGLSVVSGLAIAMPTNAAPGNKYADSTVVRDCEDNDLVTLVGPLKLWPPNHKFVNEPVTATAGDDGEQVTLTLAIEVTDAVGGDGGPNHDPDYTPEEPAATGTDSATVALNLRAERSGKGDGRTYKVDWVAEFSDKTCTSGDEGQSPFVITVPHDMRGGADWK